MNASLGGRQKTILKFLAVFRRLPIIMERLLKIAQYHTRKLGVQITFLLSLFNLSYLDLFLFDIEILRQSFSSIIYKLKIDIVEFNLHQI